MISAVSTLARATFALVLPHAATAPPPRTPSAAATTPLPATADPAANPTFSTPPIAATSTGDDGHCTVYVVQGPKWHWGPTWTAWPATVTNTVYVDCGDCKNVLPFKIGGHGPVVSFNTTVTAPEPTTVAKLECGSSGEATTTK